MLLRRNAAKIVLLRVGAPPNKQLERTVIRRHVRAARASFHYAHASRWTRGHAAAELRRYTSRRGRRVRGWALTPMETGLRHER